MSMYACMHVRACVITYLHPPTYSVVRDSKWTCTHAGPKNRRTHPQVWVNRHMTGGRAGQGNAADRWTQTDRDVDM